MNCRTAEKLISAHLDKELSSRQEAQLELHLAACPACRAKEASVRSAMQIVGEWPGVEPRLGYGDLQARLAASRKPAGDIGSRWRLPVPAWTAALLAVISVAVGGAAGVRTQELATTPRPSEQQVLTAMDIGAFQAGDVIEASVHTAVDSSGAGEVR